MPYGERFFAAWRQRSNWSNVLRVVANRTNKLSMRRGTFSTFLAKDHVVLVFYCDETSCLMHLIFLRKRPSIARGIRANHHSMSYDEF